MVTLPSASRLSAEGGGNQAITVLAGMSEAFAPVMAAIVTSPRICRTAHPTEAACLHMASADVMDITESSISFARPGHADSRHSYCAHTAAPFPTPALGRAISKPPVFLAMRWHHGRHSSGRLYV
jgi:hypothetical protein